MYKLFDVECPSCHDTWEALVSDDEEEMCPKCNVKVDRLMHAMGTAHRAQTDPVKQAEIMSKTQHMKLRMTGKLPWRKSSYSQTD
jgi:hypothetical protein